ncbi:MAG: hypothetical protein KBI41_07030 [Kiritimatiellae bacterium]|jgi:hypothetical protein|nr:hypothetical protein [Kiritimatiellia bacterium]MDD2348973.1 hypothetical protein [Kiritimatiellia bacterium]HHU15345.1 hypothetical protein [Lentisphaerota bacterium]HON47037.1 hypothetical protein [Kiritimatiellia bacterium]
MNGNRNTVSCSAFLSRLARLCALAVAGLFAATATADPYLTFSSADTFTITPQEALWDGTLQYSTDGQNWAAFGTAGATAADDGSGTYKLYLQGTDNTRISAATTNAIAWTLTAAGTVACSGNIEALLDHAAVAAGQHPAMADYCFANLFTNWTALVQAPALPATTMTTYCYGRMFLGCTGLTRAPVLPAMTLAPVWCYGGMFRGCTGLTKAPALPATTLAERCYQAMFNGCTGLVQAPALPATTLADQCYGGMFWGCTGLTKAPELPATTLAYRCYSSMFRRCTGLTQAPALPATTLTDHCYDCMFEGCTGLTQVPALPATTLAPYCYGAMFWGCTGLTWVPKLSATALADYCYAGMFRDCAGISLHAQGPGTEWSIPSAAVPATGWHNGMFAGTSGTFTGNPVIGVVYYCTSGSGPGPDPDDPEAPNIVAITVDPGASTLAITIDNAITGAWYTLLVADELGDPWAVSPAVQATADGILIFQNVPATLPHRFYKVRASATQP